MDFDIKSTTQKDSFIDKKQFNLTIYSPVFIGSGQANWIKGIDFFISDSNLYKVDIPKVFEHSKCFDPEKLYNAFSEKGIEEFLKETFQRNEEWRSFVTDFGSTNVTATELFVPITDVFGNPYLPGSSIKGSLRTAVFAQLFKDKKISKYEYESHIDKKWVKNASSGLTKLLLQNTNESELFSNYDIGRIFRVEDVPFKKSELEPLHISVVNKAGSKYQWKNLSDHRNYPNIHHASKISVFGFNNTEAVGIKSTTMSIDANLFSKLDLHSLIKDQFDWKFLAKCCNDLSEKIINIELEYFDSAKDDLPVLNDVIDDLDALLDEIKACRSDVDNNKISWIQRLGWGSGWTSMTGAHAYDIAKDDELIEVIRNKFKLGRPEADFPKSRKVVLDNAQQPFSTMGWILIEEAPNS